MKLSKEEVCDKLKEIYLAMNEGAVLDDFDLDTQLRTGLQLTSVGMLYFVIIIEDAFGVQFEGSSMDNFVTVNDVVEYIWSRQG